MAPLRVSFIIRAVYDLLPSNTNLVKWGQKDDPSCPLCQQRQTLDHVLSTCKTALGQGRYTWRHNKVLKVIADQVSVAAEKANKKTAQSNKYIHFVEAGTKISQGEYDPPRKSVLDGATDWEMTADLPEFTGHSSPIKETGKRPDIVLQSEMAKQIIMIELTVPAESRMEEQHIYKTEKYQDLIQEVKKSGYSAKVQAVEVGARGLVGTSLYDLFKKVGIHGSRRTRALKEIAETAEKASSWLWSKRNEQWNISR